MTIFDDRRMCPVCVRTDKCKELLNKNFQEMLKRECIQFEVCGNPDVKFCVFERAHQTIRDMLYKYFTKKK